MSWKLKLDSEKNTPIIDEEGRITYIDPDGKDIGLNPPAMYQKIADLGKENQKHRLKYKELKEKFALFDKIEDVSEWKAKAEEALRTVENYNDKEYLKADKVDKLKADITSAYEDKIKQLGKIYSDKEVELKNQVSSKDDQIRRLLISKHFAMSKYFSGGGEKSKTVLPSDIAEDHFGRNFRIEDGPDGLPTVKAFYSSGEPVLSRQNPGEPADFEEAIGLIIDKYPGKDHILRGGTKGSGGSGGTGENFGKSEIEILRKNLSEALKNGNPTEAITLKNRIFALERKQAS